VETRLLTADGVSAAAGLAVDETLAQRAGRGDTPPTLRLYTYAPHAALVGRFQNLEHEVDVAACERLGIALGRRPTGGGAILMGPDQLGIALAIPAADGPFDGRARELMSRFSNGLVNALRALGIEARFRGKNDVMVDSRKIAGLGVQRTPSGGLLFHGSLLVSLDVPLMTRVLRTPFKRITEREIATIHTRIATIRGLLDADVAMDAVRRRVADGYAQSLGTAPVPGVLSEDEARDSADLEHDKYSTPEWLRQETAVPDSTAAATTRTPGGQLEIRVRCAGPMLKALSIGGDFFAADDALADLEAALRWRPCEPETVGAAVREVFDRRGPELGTLTPESLTSAILAAASQDRPYGCFVTPEGHRG